MIRHYCLSLPTPAGQNDLASPSVALKEGGGGSETGGMGGAGGRWRQIPKRDESGMKETGVTKIKPQSRTACEQRRCHLERHRQNVRGGGEKLTGGTQQAKPGGKKKVVSEDQNMQRLKVCQTPEGTPGHWTTSLTVTPRRTQHLFCPSFFSM